MNWATGYSISGRELFSNYKKKLYSAQGIKIAKFFGNCRKRDYIMGIVFSYGVLLIIKDIILNNITFRLPTRTEAYIRAESIVGEDFIKARKNGAFLDVDFFASNFTGNVLMYRYKTKAKWKCKRVYVSKWMKDKLTENTNEGMRYN